MENKKAETSTRNFAEKNKNNNFITVMGETEARCGTSSTIELVVQFVSRRQSDGGDAAC